MKPKKPGRVPVEDIHNSTTRHRLSTRAPTGRGTGGRIDAILNLIGIKVSIMLFGVNDQNRADHECDNPLLNRVDRINRIGADHIFGRG